MVTPGIPGPATSTTAAAENAATHAVWSTEQLFPKDEEKADAYRPPYLLYRSRPDAAAAVADGSTSNPIQALSQQGVRGTGAAFWREIHITACEYKANAVKAGGGKN